MARILIILAVALAIVIGLMKVMGTSPGDLVNGAKDATGDAIDAAGEAAEKCW